MRTSPDKKYWVTDNGMLMTTTRGITVGNGRRITRRYYYQLLKKQKEIERRLLNEIGL